MIRVLSVVMAGLIVMFTDATFMPPIGPVIFRPMVPGPFPHMGHPGMMKPMFLPGYFRPMNHPHHAFLPPMLHMKQKVLHANAHAAAKAATAANVQNHIIGKRKRLLLIRRNEEALHHQLKKATLGAAGINQPRQLPVNVATLGSQPGFEEGVPVVPLKGQVPQIEPVKIDGRVSGQQGLRQQRFRPRVRRPIGEQMERRMIQGFRNPSPSLPMLRESVDPIGNRVRMSGPRRGTNNRNGPGPQRRPISPLVGRSINAGPIGQPLPIVADSGRRAEDISGSGAVIPVPVIEGAALSANPAYSIGDPFVKGAVDGFSGEPIVASQPTEVLASGKSRVNLAPYVVNPMTDGTGPIVINRPVDLPTIDVQPLASPPLTQTPGIVDPLPPVPALPGPGIINTLPQEPNPLGGSFIDLTSINPADSLGNFPLGGADPGLISDMQDAQMEFQQQLLEERADRLQQNRELNNAALSNNGTEVPLSGQALGETSETSPTAGEPTVKNEVNNEANEPLGQTAGETGAGNQTPPTSNTAVSQDGTVVDTNPRSTQENTVPVVDGGHPATMLPARGPPPSPPHPGPVSEPVGTVQATSSAETMLQGIDPALLNEEVLVIDAARGTTGPTLPLSRVLGLTGTQAGLAKATGAGSGGDGHIDVVTLDNAAFSRLEQAIAAGQQIDAAFLDSLIGGGTSGGSSLSSPSGGLSPEIYILDTPQTDPVGVGSNPSRRVNIPQAHSVIDPRDHDRSTPRHGVQTGHGVGTVGDPVGSIVMDGNVKKDVVGLFSVPHRQLDSVPASVSSIPKSINDRMTSSGHSRHPAHCKFHSICKSDNADLDHVLDKC